MSSELDQVKADIASAKAWIIGHVWTAVAIVAVLLFFKII